MPKTHIHRFITAVFCSYCALVPSYAAAQTQPYDMEFVLTAYYSPLPDQCCYVKGSLDADKILNGNGTHGADGTPVYPGMIAAPPSYPFGTRIVLPGIGTFTVHDRGGAIQEWEDSHRLDIWAGKGEEGLARALAFGVQRVRGTVYPPGAAQPAEAMDLASLPAPEERLKPYLVATDGMLDAHPKAGDRGLSVRMLQEQLAGAGYFSHAVTGVYGEVTEAGLRAFIADMRLAEPSDQLTDVTAAYLAAAKDVKTDNAPVSFVDSSSGAPDIRQAQRLLRFLGHYKGRTDGRYSDHLFNAILSYQKEQGLVGDAASPGAGRIGPKTRDMLTKAWTRNRVEARAKQILDKKRIQKTLADRGDLVDRFMREGAVGDMVRTVQRALVRRGLFPADKVNGVFGPLTRDSVLRYQLERGIVSSAHDDGAGTIGPVTLQILRADQIRATYGIVRAYGWQAL